MTVQTDFYDRVKELAKSHNTTVRAVMENCQINYDSYNSCKRYGNLPRADEAVRIAEYLDTSVEYLVTGENSVKPDTSELEKTLNLALSQLKNL